MDVYEAIRTRKSVRAFRDVPVEQPVLLRVMEAARAAPSAKNAQEWRFVAVRDRETRERIARDAARQTFIGTAPVLLACCAEPTPCSSKKALPQYVKEGIVNYLPETQILQFEITPTMKTHVKRVLGHIKRIIQTEDLPPIRVAKYKCQGGCGHKQTCQQG